MTNRTPQMERAIVGSLLTECPPTLPTSIAKLLHKAPESFDDQRLGKVAVAIRNLHHAGKPIFPASVQRMVEDVPVDFITGLTPDSIPLELAEADALEIWKAYQTRQRMATIGEANDELKVHPDRADTIAANVQRCLAELDGGETRLVARPIGSLLQPRNDDGNELLKHRYLCRGGGLLLVGQSGQGKSSVSLQMAVEWSLGRPSFGIAPTRPLRILVIQAENDSGDMWEMFHGIASGLGLTTEQREAAGAAIYLHTEDSMAGAEFCSRVVEPLVRAHSPDIIIIDPALAYVDGDTKDAEAVGGFLRRGLNPVLHRNNCAAVIIHHTTKQKADGPQKTHDFLYAGAGSIEFTNWARAVLVLETKGAGCYRLHAPKRGARLGWRDAHGELCFDRFIRHTREPGQICWEEVSEAEIESAGKSGKTSADLLRLVPIEGSIPQSVLLDKASTAGIGQKKCRALLDELIESKQAWLWLVKRSGTNPEKRISRHAQPHPELP